MAADETDRRDLRDVESRTAPPSARRGGKQVTATATPVRPPAQPGRGWARPQVTLVAVAGMVRRGV